MKDIRLLSEEDFLVLHGDYDEYKKIMASLESGRYYENIYCPLYLCGYIEKYVRLVFDIINTKSGFGFRTKYWTINWKGEKLKIKHLSSCLNLDNYSFHWTFAINYNRGVDAFLLTAYDDVESLKPEHMWFIRSKEIFKTKRDEKEFWERPLLRLYDTEKILNNMKKYELEDELKKLKEIMHTLSFERMYDNNIHKLILDKKIELEAKKGYKIHIREIIECAIRIGLKLV